jgi:dienelactone hydrolase
MMTRVNALLVVAALVALTGCGSQGTGDRDGPAGSTDASTARLDTGVRSAPDGRAGYSSTDTGDSVDAGHRAGDSGQATTADAAGTATGHHDASRDSSAPPTEASTADLGKYAASGPDTVTTASFSVTSSTDTFTTTAYIPSGAGPFPVVILGSGFQQDGDAYAPYAERLASWGVITFLRNDPGAMSSLTSSDLASDMAYLVTTWLSSTSGDATSALHDKVDTSKIGLAGHSRGGQVALLAAEGGAKGKVLGVFGLDPVDTASDNVEARTTIATVDVPVAFIGETTDGTGGVLDLPCAPAADNFLVLYQAASSPAVAITAINADHTMFEDPSDCSFCSMCTPGTASTAEVLDTSVRYLTAFFARQLLGDATVGGAFAGAGIQTDVAAGLVAVESK